MQPRSQGNFPQKGKLVFTYGAGASDGRKAGRSQDAALAVDRGRRRVFRARVCAAEGSARRDGRSAGLDRSTRVAWW